MMADGKDFALIKNMLVSTFPTTITQVGTDISHAAYLLRCCEVVGIPTETVYGLAGNAYNSWAVQQIFSVKRRPCYDPLIVHTDSLQKAEDFVRHIPYLAYELAKYYMPGPLTLLLPRKANIPDVVTSGLDTVAIRIPNHPMTLALLEILDFPLAAPSANPFGYISPTTAFHVAQQLGAFVPYILDGGMCSIGIESTILGFPNGYPTIYRLGGLSVEAIESVIGPVIVRNQSTSNPSAPGLLMSHYAPRTPLYMGRPDTVLTPSIGYLSLNQYDERIPFDYQIQLSPSGNLEEAAHHLYAALRTLDRLGLDAIYAEWMPAYGLGLAINDRLKRASAK